MKPESQQPSPQPSSQPSPQPSSQSPSNPKTFEERGAVITTTSVLPPKDE